MAKFPRKPRAGQKTIAALYRSICEVIDYLPSLTVKGDGRSIGVSNTSKGSIISIKNKGDSSWKYEGDYPLFYFGDGIKAEYEEEVISGLEGISKELLPQYVSLNIVGDNQYISAYYPSSLSGQNSINSAVVISYIGPTPSGGGPSGGGIEYHDGRFITISGDNTINCTLSTLLELYNYPIISDTRPLSTEIESTFVYPNHFMQFKDWIGNKGQNTIVTSGSFINTHTGAGDPGSWQYIFQYTGPQVDCVLTGGRFIEVNSHWQDSGGETPEQQEPDDHTINSLLSGDGNVYPNTAGKHIFIHQLSANANGSWGGIISTNLHGDGTSVTIDNDGTIHATGGSPSPGPGGGCPWPNYDNLGEESDSLVYPLMRYTTTSGGWLRISCRGGTSRCVGVWIDDNYYGLGIGVMTWPLAIPPGCSFYVDVDWNPNTFVWFDSAVTPDKITREEFNYWLQPPTWEPNRDTILSAKQKLEQARGAEQDCYTNMICGQVYLKSMINDWTEYVEGVKQQPQSSGWYEDCLNHISGYYDSCSASYDTANDYCLEGTLLNTSLPSANPMYTYQFRDISQKCQQYTETIQQYITSGQYYLGLAIDYWNSHE